MKILITGCAGFIGYHICKQLLNDNIFEVFGIDNISDYYDVKLKKSIIFGLFITVSWFIYYTNEYGFSHFTIYTLISIILQLHILRNITIKEKSS